jgi:hypothetical protein
MSGQVGCTIRNAAHDLRRLRAEHVAGKPGRSAGTSSHPVPLASVAGPPIRRTPRHWTDIDWHYKALRLEMNALSADIGIACGEAPTTTTSCRSEILTRRRRRGPQSRWLPWVDEYVAMFPP